jgi:hypothetical protein
MTATLLTALLSFIASHASGILTGVVGMKITAWIATRLNTKTERAIYTDLILPLVQSVAVLLQNVQTEGLTTTTKTAPAQVNVITTKSPSVTLSPAPATAHYND